LDFPDGLPGSIEPIRAHSQRNNEIRWAPPNRAGAPFRRQALKRIDGFAPPMRAVGRELARMVCALHEHLRLPRVISREKCSDLS
jgi:hypothetical protein